MKSKAKIVLALMGIVTFAFMMIWAAFKPGVMASVSHETYQQATYSFDVVLDTYSSETGEEVNGIRAIIQPQLADERTSLPSTAYLNASQQRLQQWVSKRTGDEFVDVMLMFARPLTMAEANEILASTNAEVFESAVVGYVYGVPFVDYAVENEALLTRSLTEVAESQHEFMIEAEKGHIEEADLTLVGDPVDVRGYLAVRVWIKVNNLNKLDQTPEVRFIDTTPQAVRDQLNTDSNWRNMSVTWLSLPMPVWAYDW